MAFLSKEPPPQSTVGVLFYGLTRLKIKNEESDMQAASKKNNFLCTPQSFGKITKDPLCAMLLGQLYFWGLTEDEWFDRTQTKIFEITSISTSQQNTAREKLQEMGFIDVERRGIPARLFYKVNYESIELAHEMIGYDLPDYRSKKSSQQPKTFSEFTEKNLPSDSYNKLQQGHELKEKSKELTYSLTESIKITPETLETARKVCVKLEGMGIDRLPSADDPLLLFTVECGATLEQFESSAKVAMKDKAKANFNYVVARVRNRLEDAARLAANPVVRGKARAVYQASSWTPTHASHIETPPEPPKKKKTVMPEGWADQMMAGIKAAGRI